MKKCIEQSSETGIAEVFVERRHGAWFDFAPEPVAHHHVITFAQFFHESRHVAEVVAVVRIPMMMKVPRAPAMPARSATP